jgi:hypothetical protein
MRPGTEGKVFLARNTKKARENTEKAPALNAFLTPEEKYELPQPLVNLTQHRKSLKKEGQGLNHPALWGTSPAIPESRV